MARLLIVDNDKHSIEQMSGALQSDGHQIAIAHSMEEAIRALHISRSDMLLYGSDGLKARECGTIRTDPMLVNLPIICIVANYELEARLDCFRQGADDCIGRPFEPAELVARVNAVLRRTQQAEENRETQFLALNGRLAVDPFTHTVWVDQQTVQLTPLEFQLFFKLVCAAGRPCSSEQLLEAIWGHIPGTGDPTLLRTQIKNLRRKLGAIDNSVEWVLTIPNIGYAVPA